MSKWRKWRELPRADRSVLALAVVQLVYARLRLPFITFRADPGGSEHLRSGMPPENALARAQVIADLVAVAASHSPVRASCLHRSLVLWWTLCRHGIPCEIRLGARTESGPFEAHAWVQCAGVALNGQPDDLAGYSPFAVAVVPVGRRRPWPLVTRRVP